MNKKKIGAKTFLYPMPIALVGTKASGKVNFMTIAYMGIVNHTPPMLSIALRESHYSNFGIKEYQEFSVNFPTQEMIKVVDYCGLTSGANTDKSQLFEVFYGGLEHAPLISECPLNLECKVLQMIEFDQRTTYIAEIMQAHCSEQYLTNGLPDMAKMKPLIFSMHDNVYWSLGEAIGTAWNIGLTYKP